MMLMMMVVVTAVCVKGMGDDVLVCRHLDLYADEVIVQDEMACYVFAFLRRQQLYFTLSVKSAAYAIAKLIGCSYAIEGMREKVRCL